MMENDHRHPPRKTAGQLAELFGSMPANLPVEFSPITDAWLGTFGPMRIFSPPKIFSGDGRKTAKPGDEGAYMIVYLYEDESD